MGVGEEEGTEKSQKPMFIHTHLNTSEGVEEPRGHHLSDASSTGRESPPEENRPSVPGDIKGRGSTCMAVLASHAWKQNLVSECSGKRAILQGEETLLTIPTEVQGAQLRSTGDM